MKTINKQEYEILKKETDSANGGYEVANFKINAFTTDLTNGNQNKEKMEVKGEILKDDKNNDMFVFYDTYHDGSPQWHAYGKDELASPQFEVIEKTSILNEDNKKIKLDIEMQEYRKKMEEERSIEAKRRFENFEKNKKLNERETEIKNEHIFNEDKLDFLSKNGYLLEVTNINEDEMSLSAKMVDKYGNTLANFNYSNLLSFEDIDPSEGFEVHESDGDEMLYPFLADEDSLKITDSKGKVIEDTGAVTIAKESIESLKIWKNEDLEYAKNYYVELESPKNNVTFKDFDVKNVFKTLKETSEKPSTQKLAKLRTEHESEKQRTKRKI
jgi:hypothetical protein